jgi:hypothetical protein
MNIQPIEFIKTKKEAAAIIGGELRNNKKMPCKTFNLSAWHCKTGGLLHLYPVQYVLNAMQGTAII